MKDFIVVSLYGQKAVNRAYAIQNGNCYADISDGDGRKIAQMEITIDEPGTYNGLVQKWVDITIVSDDLETTLSKLAEIGFSRTWALIELQRENGTTYSKTMYPRGTKTVTRYAVTITDPTTRQTSRKYFWNEYIATRFRAECVRNGKPAKILRQLVEIEPKKF